MEGVQQIAAFILVEYVGQDCDDLANIPDPGLRLLPFPLGYLTSELV